MTGSRPILVTGASGFLGEAVCRALAGASRPVLAVHHLRPPPLEHPAVRWVQADLSSAVPLRGERGMEFGAVIHLAALLPSAATSTEEAARLNRHIDDRVFRWAAARAASVIYASGTSVYGDLRGEALVDERASVSPLDPYLQAKADGERSGADIVHKGGGRFVALRICAPYGPRQTARTVLQVFVERALASEPLLYYGTGLREQAFTFASDAAAACLLALEAGDGCFNIAGSPAITMKDLATMVARLAGKPAHFVRAAGRPDPQEGRRARFDTRRAARELGWTPKVPLRDGLLLCLQARRPEALA